jgi:hypothetical protein
LRIVVGKTPERPQILGAHLRRVLHFHRIESRPGVKNREMNAISGRKMAD